MFCILLNVNATRTISFLIFAERIIIEKIKTYCDIFYQQYLYCSSTPNLQNLCKTSLQSLRKSETIYFEIVLMNNLLEMWKITFFSHRDSLRILLPRKIFVIYFRVDRTASRVTARINFFLRIYVFIFPRSPLHLNCSLYIFFFFL